MSERPGNFVEMAPPNQGRGDHILSDALQQGQLSDRRQMLGPAADITPASTAATFMPHLEIGAKHGNDCPKQRICVINPAQSSDGGGAVGASAGRLVQQFDRTTGHLLTEDRTGAFNSNRTHSEYDPHTQQRILREVVGNHEIQSSEALMIRPVVGKRTLSVTSERVQFDKHTGLEVMSDIHFKDGRTEHSTFDPANGRKLTDQVTLANGAIETHDQMRYDVAGRLLGERIKLANGDLAVLTYSAQDQSLTRKELHHANGSTDLVLYDPSFFGYTSALSVTRHNPDGSSAYTKFGPQGRPQSVTLTDAHGGRQYFEVDTWTGRMHRINRPH